MANNLNGWRRIALALSLLWIGIAVTMAIVDYSRKKNGFFVYQGIPVGTLVTGDTIVLPDGRKTQISDQEEIEFAIRHEKEQGENSVPVQMPDGTIVDMPNKLTPELAIRLKALLLDPQFASSLTPKAQKDKQDVKTRGFDLTSARPVKPWEVYWSKQESITTTKIQWSRFGFVGIATPLLLWLFAELFAVVIRWVVRGFRESKL